ESPVQFECKVNDIIELGQNGGAGNLVICEVVKIHINEAVLDGNGMIDQHKIDLVSRMGGNWYCRADKNSMFEIQKPITTIGIGVDQIPEGIRNSIVLTGNDLGLLGSVEAIPTEQEVTDFNARKGEKHQIAQSYIEQGKVLDAWKVLLK
ncbi:MAG: flavin reductase family protein, partial [Flavobacteriales bacterium]|nr:flavin reductase family protein [Flavobacteriales bacterium]